VRRLVILFLVIAAAGSVRAQDTSDRALVLAAVQTFLDVIGNRDVDAARRVMLPEGRLISSRDEDGKLTFRPQTHQEFFESLLKGQGKNLERMWNPEVRIHGTIATVSTPYDFHRDGKFSHCGTDVFNLVKTPEGWKIAGAMWTIQRTGCAPSPLGPPK
jgi:hypothetical protein